MNSRTQSNTNTMKKSIGLKQNSENIYFRKSNQKLIKQTGKISMFSSRRSSSRSQNKNRFHLFRRNNSSQEKTLSKHPEMTSSQSYYGQDFKPKIYQETKTTIKNSKSIVSNDVFANKKKQSIEEKKQKKEFKLICQLKKEKAQKRQQQNQKKDVRKLYKMNFKSKSNQMKVKTNSRQNCEKSPEISDKTKIKLISNSIIQKKEENNETKLKENQTKVQIDFLEEQTQQTSSSFQTPETPFTPTTPLPKPDLNRSISKAQTYLKNHSRRNSMSQTNSQFRQSMMYELEIYSRAGDSRFSEECMSPFLRRNQQITVKDKIFQHIEMLEAMSRFVFESASLYATANQWEQLNFLIYKKYYIERLKIVHFIKKYPMKNPFCIYGAEVSSKQLISFMKQPQFKSFQQQIVSETNLVRQKLNKFYCLFSKEKIGEMFNMYEFDNFSHWVIEQLWADLILTEHQTGYSRQTIELRLCRILQLIFLISEINGKFECGYSDAENAIRCGKQKGYIREGKQIFEKYLQYGSE